MGMSNYTNFLNGVTIRGIPILQLHPGKIFWVNNSGVLPEGGVGGSDGNKGTYLQPWSTIDYAIGRCTANRGDIILVMPGHTETITAADAILLDIAGVALVGVGNGLKMAEVEFNHADATIGVSANNVSIVNMRLNSTITAVTVGINVKADVSGVTITRCLFDVDTAGTDEFNHSIRLVDGNTRCVIEENVIDMGIAGAVAGIHLDADTAFTIIRKNIIRGDFSTANIAGDTTLSTNILIEDNLLENGIGGNINTEPGIELLTGSTGTIRRNDIVCNLATKAASIVADTCLLFENYYNEDISSSATGGIIGTASADD